MLCETWSDLPIKRCVNVILPISAIKPALNEPNPPSFTTTNLVLRRQPPRDRRLRDVSVIDGCVGRDVELQTGDDTHEQPRYRYLVVHHAYFAQPYYAPCGGPTLRLGWSDTSMPLGYET